LFLPLLARCRPGSKKRPSTNALVRIIANAPSSSPLSLALSLSQPTLTHGSSYPLPSDVAPGAEARGAAAAAAAAAGAAGAVVVVEGPAAAFPFAAAFSSSIVVAAAPPASSAMLLEGDEERERRSRRRALAR